MQKSIFVCLSKDTTFKFVSGELKYLTLIKKCVINRVVRENHDNADNFQKGP